MDAKKKPALALVVGDEEDSKDKPMETEKDEDSELDAASEELWEAIQNGDQDAFKTAIRAVKAC